MAAEFETTHPDVRLGDLTQELDGFPAEFVAGHGLARAARLLQKELQIARADMVGRSNFMESPPELKQGLHMGCGRNILSDWTNLDMIGGEGVDVVCDTRNGLPFENNTFATIFSEHMMEHVDYPISFKGVLGEMHRVLRPGGRIIIGLPDASIPTIAYANNDLAYFEELRARWYSNRLDGSHHAHPIDLVRLVMADADDDPVYNPHFAAFDTEKITDNLLEAGFTNVKPWDTLPAINNPKRMWGSVYLEAVKIEQS